MRGQGAGGAGGGSGGEVQEVLVEERSTREMLAKEREELGERGGLLDNMVLLGDYKSGKREFFVCKTFSKKL